MALEEGQDGSGHSLVNADGSRRSIKDTGDQERGKDDDSDDSDDAKSVMTEPPPGFETLCLSEHLLTHLDIYQENAEDGDEALAGIRSYPGYVVQLQKELAEFKFRNVNECRHWVRKHRSKLLDLILPATNALGVSRRLARSYIRGNEKAVSETMSRGDDVKSIFSPEFADQMLAALENMSKPPSEADKEVFRDLLPAALVRYKPRPQRDRVATASQQRRHLIMTKIGKARQRVVWSREEVFLHSAVRGRTSGCPRVLEQARWRDLLERFLLRFGPRGDQWPQVRQGRSYRVADEMVRP